MQDGPGLMKTRSFERARLHSLVKNAALRRTEGAGGFSLPNKALLIQCGFSHGFSRKLAEETFSPSCSVVPQKAAKKTAALAAKGWFRALPAVRENVLNLTPRRFDAPTQPSYNPPSSC
jgi:hypothetical protein